MSNIFRAYDVRGIYPDEINEEISGKIAAATVKFLNAKKIVVGEDARLSSPSLRKSVLERATKAGCDVYHIGRCTTPLFYFSVNKLGADGGIMITASHNPPEYNGLKITGRESAPISRDTGLPEIKRISEAGMEHGSSVGSIEEISLKNEYVDFLLDESGNIPLAGKNLKIVIDASNGMTPIVLNDLLSKIKLNVSPLYFDIDGRFPNHLSDTSREENLKDLKDKVIAENADIGIAFDGDGDRMGVVDEKGNVVRADHITVLLYQNFYAGGKVVYDHRFSRAVKEAFGDNGVASKTGHSFIKTVMRQSDCGFGGELSGHFFFREMGYADSAILAMLRLVEVLTKENKPLSKLVKPFIKYANSGEINISLRIMNQYEYTNLKQGIINKLKEKYKDGKQSFLDGITVEYPDWWSNVRFSNTEPLIRIVVEADTKELMEQKKEELVSEIKNAS